MSGLFHPMRGAPVVRALVLVSGILLVGCADNSGTVATDQVTVRNEIASSSPAQKSTAWTIPMQTSGTKTPVSCAAAFSSQATEEAVASWLDGYWSGLNVGMGLTVGSTTDANGIMREIKFDCQKTPTATLHQSAHHTYNRLRAKGR